MPLRYNSIFTTVVVIVMEINFPMNLYIRISNFFAKIKLATSNFTIKCFQYGNGCHEVTKNDRPFFGFADNSFRSGQSQKEPVGDRTFYSSN